MERRHRQVFYNFLANYSLKEQIPYTATYELTYGCNYHCVHCLNPTHQATPRELKIEKIFQILEQSAELGVIFITFTGGELFTRKDVFDIFDKAKRLGFLVAVLSNASLVTREIARCLSQIGVTQFDTSIYGITPQTYEHVTGRPGSFQLFVEGISVLAEQNIPTVLRMPVLTPNAHEVLKAKEFAEKRGFQFSYSFDVQPRQDGNLSPHLVRLSAEEKTRLLNQLEGPASRWADYPSGPEKGCFMDCTCGQGRQFAITPYGEMNLCVAFPAPKYDLTTGSVREGWKALRKFVQTAGPNENYECFACEVKDFCRQGRNDAWLETGDASRCLPHFKAWAKTEKAAFTKSLDKL